MLEVADVLRRYGKAYLNAFDHSMPARHRRTIEALIACRTPALGGHLYQCDRCGQQRYAYHSCRNRHCPKCHGKDIERWLEARRQELLPVPHFHVVFTLPQELRRIVRSHPHILYGILMQTAAHALMKLARDPHYVGGQIGILAVLHTWTRTLEYHPHVHCLVPAGGLGPDGTWTPARENYLVPVKALSRIFRGMFLESARKALPDVAWPASVRGQDWVVYTKPAVQGSDNVLTYLARYVHRVALTNSSIVAIDDDKVTFKYRRVGEASTRTMTLPAKEFIRRFLQHVLPARTHKVRYYGLWAPANRKRLLHIRRKLTKDDPKKPQQPREPAPQERTCSECGKGTLHWVARLNPTTRAPP